MKVKISNLMYVVGLIIIIMDQWLKFYIRNNLEIGREIKLLPQIISLTYLQNTGAAWSFMEGNSIFFIVIALFAISIFSYFIFKNKDDFYLKTGLILMLSGTVGNLIDRFICGFVTDMFKLDFVNFPVFNIADASLSIGVVIIILSLLLEKE